MNPVLSFVKIIFLSVENFDKTFTKRSFENFCKKIYFYLIFEWNDSYKTKLLIFMIYWIFSWLSLNDSVRFKWYFEQDIKFQKRKYVYFNNSTPKIFCCRDIGKIKNK